MTGLEHAEFASTGDGRKDDLEVLWHAMSYLDSLEKSIVALYLDELPYSEIAEITGLSENNVGVKLNRLKNKIKKIISGHGIG